MEAQEVLIIMIAAVVIVAVGASTLSTYISRTAESSSGQVFVMVDAKYGGKEQSGSIVMLKITASGEIEIKDVMAVTASGNCSSYSYTPNQMISGVFEGYAAFQCDVQPGDTVVVTYCHGGVCEEEVAVVRKD